MLKPFTSRRNRKVIDEQDVETYAETVHENL